MVGLLASELQAETLFPGDTIEYFSMAFVAGDPRGHRVSKVLRVNRTDDEFPIEVDTQEMLPLTIMLKRKRDRNDVEISSDDAKWRKLRTFRLVNGEVEGETRADRLNAGLKKSLSDAMKSTKKRLALEKEEKVNAGSTKLMNKFFTKSTRAADEGETTRSQHSSLGKISTPEGKKKRKPLTPRDNTDHHSSVRPHGEVVLKKSRGGEKASRKSRPEDKTTRSERKFKYDSDKHVSRKRKRSDSTPTRPKQVHATPRTTQMSISRFFNGKQEQRRPKQKISTDLNKFVNHVRETEDIEEIEEQKRTVWGLDEFYALDTKKKALEAEKKADGRGYTRGATSNRSDNSGKSAWSQQRKNYRKTNAESGSSLRSWLKPQDNGKWQGDLEVVSGGTPKKSQRTKQRTLNLASDKPKSPMMNRKDGLRFVMSNSSGDASYHSKEVKSSKHRAASKQDGQPRKKRGSLGTVSARAPKTLNLTGNLTDKWNHRKTVR